MDRRIKRNYNEEDLNMENVNLFKSKKNYKLKN
jgi:hypothetical protein